LNHITRNKYVRILSGARKFAKELGIEVCLEFNPEMLVPEEKIRGLCRENKCGSFKNNYTCPPYIGTVEEISAKLKKFDKGLLFQYSREIDVKNNRPGVIQTKLDFHEKILRIEQYLQEQGISPVWGMIGGNCGLCDVCKAGANEPCLFPEKARMSLEAAAVDVIALLDKFGLDSDFHDDKITWT
jgi:predicted metal-binding protein